MALQGSEFNKWTRAVAISLTLSVAVLGFIQATTSIGNRSTIIFTALLTSVTGILLAVIFKTLDSNPTTVTMSLLGFPRTGKTVYLTALFDQLQQANESGIQFTPHGSETVEEVTKNLNSLSRGVWIPPTKPGVVFFYRATALTGAGLFKRKYKLEIADYAGESIGELNPFDEKWLHKTDYFKYVIQSDAVILAIDTQVLSERARDEIDEIQNAFVAAFQILAEHKGAVDGKKLKTPVALLFMKADLIREKDLEKEMMGEVSRLINVCRGRCRYFRHFFVSSVGDLGLDGQPPKHLRPIGVVEPIVWLLQHSNRI